MVDSTGLGQLFGMGPAAPLVTSYESHPITDDLENTMTVFPEARSLKTVDHEDSSFSSRELFRTSERSWGEKNTFGGRISGVQSGRGYRGPGGSWGGQHPFGEFGGGAIRTELETKTGAKIRTRMKRSKTDPSARKPEWW